MHGKVEFMLVLTCPYSYVERHGRLCIPEKGDVVDFEGLMTYWKARTNHHYVFLEG